ncbi:glucose-1-phosphate thymidylyltransferase RfbA [Anaerobutyricum soehngenii]|uniref:Glucose-1-phosphate thymidylyltransferase n=1 Tax=Anaerobutyricum soehngenii TaxID=105843 RepID=A0ABS3ZHK6_9FIRM|nr:glucose-1-phosphate thymidylyltransferase RfbA [Anaerobutyricum soehngenii]MBP0056791.1 glucose-1-phosphate thymidylyltransferase RfbA [Anaerobutyricum soehngenii]
MKGIVLAAGKGTRLYPMTKPVCKPLLPVYDKPLIYYPISTLLQAGIKDILVIIPPGEEKEFTNLLGDGSEFGIHIEFAVQKVARGIADALIIGEDFIGDDSVCLVLGDNIFHCHNLDEIMKEAIKDDHGAKVFGYYVDDPRPFGVVEFDENGQAVSIEEKPKNPKSNYIVPGLYFYDNQVIDIAKNLEPSARGEYEITDVNLEYLRRGQLKVIPFDRGLTWMDAGTADSMLEAAEIVKALQKSGCYVGCLEELAWKEGFISLDKIHEIGESLKMTNYGQYLLKLK